MITMWLEQLSMMIGQSGWLAPLLAFAAGQRGHPPRHH